MLKSSGRRIDISQPFVDAMLPEGHRLHVVLEGISRGFTAVNIRKFTLRASRLHDLVDLGTLTPRRRAVPRRRRAGRAQHPRRRRHPGRQDDPAQLPGRAIPGTDRVVSCEEVFELRFHHPDWVPMQTRQAGLEGTGEIQLRDLVKETLRMRPSRIIVGEVRAEECLDLLLALNAGLPGMCTLHANSAREALVKMCTLPLLAGENIGARFVVPTVAASVDLVVHLGIDRTGVRRVNEIVGVPGRVENDVIETETLFSRDGGELATAAGCRPGSSASPASASTSARSWAADMGVLLGLAFGLGLLLIWSAFAVPARRAATGRGPGRLRAAARPGRASPASRSAAWCCSPGAGLVAALVIQVVSGHGAGGGRVRCPRGVPPARRGQGPGPSAPAGARRGVARGRRQPRQRGARGHVAARGAGRAGHARARAAAAGVRGRSPSTTRRPGGSATRSTGSRRRWPTRSATGSSRALRIAREVGGGDLGRLLRNLSGYLRDDLRTRSELESRQAWTVNGARLAVAAPWLVLLLLCFQPEVIGRYSLAGRGRRAGRRRGLLPAWPTG